MVLRQHERASYTVTDHKHAREQRSRFGHRLAIVRLKTLADAIPEAETPEAIQLISRSITTILKHLFTDHFEIAVAAGLTREEAFFAADELLELGSKPTPLMVSWGITE